MSQYTTGEMAKACGVTVRTVQFYDQKGILIPSALSEGGRRLYSEEDLKKMKIICFLRDTGLSLDTIGQLMKEEDPESTISILLVQQEQVLREEISERREKLNRLEELKKWVESASSFSVETIGDIATIMEGQKKMSAMHRNMLLTGLPLSWALAAIPWGVLWSRYYFRHTAYICPQCHEVFRPTFKEAFFANHTPKTRKLTCVKCGHKGFCVETWGGDGK